MGASLPAIVRWIEIDAARRFLVGLALRRQHRRSGVRMLARRDSICCASMNVAVATYAAVAINLAVAAISFRWPRASGTLRSRRCLRRGRRRAVSPSRGARQVRWTDLSSPSRSRAPRAGRGGGVDPADGHAAGRHGLRFLHHPGGLPDRHGARQRGRSVDRALQSAARALALGWCQILLDAGHRLEPRT